MKLTLSSSEIKDFDRRAGSPREIIVHLNHSRPTHIKFPPSLTFIFVGHGTELQVDFTSRMVSLFLKVRLLSNQNSYLYRPKT